MADLKQETIKIGDTEYILQKLPARKALELRREWTKSGTIDEITMFEKMLEHIIVKPRKTIDDFEDISELTYLCNQAIVYQYGGKYSKNLEAFQA